jgi:hypothetical protein
VRGSFWYPVFGGAMTMGHPLVRTLAVVQIELLQDVTMLSRSYGAGAAKARTCSQPVSSKYSLTISLTSK